jgi:hypothetical protein
MSVKVAQMLRPFNKGFSALQIKLVMNDLVFRYIKNIQNKIKIRTFVENNVYFIYAKIPSESGSEYPDSPPIHYDVILQLTPPNKAAIAWTDIREYDAKVYSNIPSFVFTFNYVYHFKRALINLPGDYYTHKAMQEKPKVRNPLNLLGIEKSLWFTVYHLDYNRLFKKRYIDSLLVEGLTLAKLLKEERIKTQDQKIAECELREKHKRDLKEVERKRKGRAASRVKEIKRPVKKNETAEIFSDLSSGLRDEHLSNSNLVSSLNNSSKSKNIPNTPIRSNYKSSLKSNLKSSLRSR